MLTFLLVAHARARSVTRPAHTSPSLFVCRSRQYSRAQEREALAHIEHRFRTPHPSNWLSVSTKNSAFKEIFLKILLNFCRYGGLNRAAQLGASYGSVGANCCQQIDDEHQRHVQRRERVSQARLRAAILCRNNSCRAQPQQHRRGDRP